LVRTALLDYEHFLLTHFLAQRAGNRRRLVDLDDT